MWDSKYLLFSLFPNTDIDKLVSVKGMVIRCSSIIPEIKGAFFKCLVCGHSPPLVTVVKGELHSIQLISLVIISSLKKNNIACL